MGWGDGSVRDVLALQAWRPELIHRAHMTSRGGGVGLSSPFPGGFAGGEEEEEIPGVSWLASLACLMSYRHCNRERPQRSPPKRWSGT